MATGQLAESRRSPLRLNGTPVFLYHGLTRSDPANGVGRERKYWLSTARFREQLNLIRWEGCKVALLSELPNADDPSNRQGSTVCVTFDDGRWSDYELALPLLLESDLRAEFFVNTANIGREGFLGWCQVREMQRAGMSFQSHGHEHVDLSSLYGKELERQLSVSKHMLEDHLSRRVEFLAVPYGRLSKRLLEAALQVGYRALCSSRSWPARTGSLTVNRVVIYAHTSLGTFGRLLSRNALSYAARAARAILLYLPKSALRRFRPPEFDPAPLGDLI